MAKHLVNNNKDCVKHLIEGLLLTNPALSCVEGYNILVRKDIEVYKQHNVSIISGGGSGHEPAHAGYIGDGMLTCAVLGNIFASPSVASILAAIRVVSGPKGVLLIVKNYTGDRLNFGIAMEMAKQDNIKIDMVVVDDDCALDTHKGITGGRGIAGTVLIHKMAGALAANGVGLEDTVTAVKSAVSRMSTIGVALSACTIPGATVSDRLDGERMYEIGMGIHGEPGREQRSLPESNAAETVAQIMVDSILNNVNGKFSIDNNSSNTNGCDREVVVMVNNLGTLPVMELYIMARSIIQALTVDGWIVARVYCGTFMTALNMNGISLTLLRVDPACNDISLLDQVTTAPAWANNSTTAVMTLQDTDLAHRCVAYDESKYIKQVNGGPYCHVLTYNIITAACSKLIAIESKLTEYDLICGDGDCGIVMSKGAQAVLQAVTLLQSTVADGTNSADREAAVSGSNNNGHKVTDMQCSTLCDKLANTISQSMGGTSGVLLEIMFRAMATHFIAQNAEMTIQELTTAWSVAFSKGVATIQTYGGARPGMRTMLDALVPAVDTLLASPDNINGATLAAAAGAESTKTMVSLAGRSNYINQSTLKGVPDPGAVAVAAVFEAINNCYNL